MSQAKIGDTVQVHYKGTLDDGTVFDSSEGRQPLQFTLGQSQVIPGFEQGLIGMEPGQSRTIRVASEQGYGPRQDDRVLTVPRDQIPGHIQPQVGQMLEVRQPGGQGIPVRITEVDDARVTLDANHPLAGKTLHFDVQVRTIRKASEDEMAHGHAHGPDGHHHH